MVLAAEEQACLPCRPCSAHQLQGIANFLKELSFLPTTTTTRSILGFPNEGSRTLSFPSQFRSLASMPPASLVPGYHKAITSFSLPWRDGYSLLSSPCGPSCNNMSKQWRIYVVQGLIQSQEHLMTFMKV